MKPVTMGRNKRMRVPFTIIIEGEGAAAKAVLVLPDCIVTMDAADWHRIVAMFRGELPSIYLRRNRSAGGRTYLGVTLPRGLGAPKGRDAMLARVIMDAEDIQRHHIHYRDDNPFNLCRSNLELVDRKAAAAKHTGG
jgi:hypothetical protein